MALTPTTLLQATGPYTAKQTRFALGAGSPVQTGVFKTHSASPLLVTQQSTPALAVDIAPGGAVFRENQSTGFGINGTGSAPGVYSQLSDSVTAVSAGITAGHASLPRIDQIFMVVHDTVDAADSTNTPEFRVIAGAPTSGADLDTRTGAASDAAITATLGQNWVRLADFLMPPNATTVLAANIRDRRRWAYGACYRLSDTVTTSYVSGTNSTISLSNRVELSGAPFEVYGSVLASASGATGKLIAARITVGAAVAARGTTTYTHVSTQGNVIAIASCPFTHPGAGSQIVRMRGDYALPTTAVPWDATQHTIVLREILTGLDNN